MQPDAKQDYHNGHRQRMRERYARSGTYGMADYEIVEMLLALLIPRIDVKPIAKDLIAKFKNLRGILDAPREELEKVRGIGLNTALALKFVKDTITVYHTDELKCEGMEIPTITKLIKYFKAKIVAEQNEVLEMLCFDTKLRIIGDSSVRLVEGTVSSANVDIRKIVEVAIKRGASSIAIAHNHPSGDPHPSLDDVRFTRRLSETCRALSISLIEHVIVAKSACFSFRREGHIDDLYDETVHGSGTRAYKTADSLEKLL